MSLNRKLLLREGKCGRLVYQMQGVSRSYSHDVSPPDRFIKI